MARPHKQGLDYFPLDVHVDDKLKFIRAKFGWAGYGIIIGVFQHIYSHGYWCSWSGDDDFLYAAENNIDRPLLLEIVDEALKRRLFSIELYEKYQILTSRGIQKRYAEVIKRRKNVSIKAEYVLIGEALCKHDASIMQTPCKHDDDKSTQTESKVNGKETESESESETSVAILPQTGELEPVFEQMRKVLCMTNQEITTVYGRCSDPPRLTEAFQCAVEYDAHLRKKEGKALDDPVSYIAKMYDRRKVSGKTRFQSGTNNTPVHFGKKQRSWQEVADAMESDGTEFGIRLNFKD